MEDAGQLLGLLEVHVLLLGLLGQLLVVVARAQLVRLEAFDALLPFAALLLGELGAEAFQEVLVLLEVLQGLLLGHVLACEVSLDLELLLDDGHFLVLLSRLCFCLLDGVSGLLFILGEVVVEVLHVLLEHLLCPFESLFVELGEFLEFVDFLSFVVDEHLEEEGLPLLADELVHGLVDFDSILDGVLGGLDEAGLGLIAAVLLLLLSELVELSYGDSLFLDSLLPDLESLVSLLLLLLAFFLLLLHAEDLSGREGTSASSGMAKGLSYLGLLLWEFTRGRLCLLESASSFISYKYRIIEGIIVRCRK